MNEKLKELRLKKGYDQYKLAEKVGISQQAYSQIETGAVNPSLKTALKLSEVLKVPVNKIFCLK